MNNRFPRILARTLFIFGIFTALILFSSPTRIAFGADEAKLDGTVLAGGKAWHGARITLNVGTRAGATQLAEATTNDDGSFHFDYTLPSEGIVYVTARAENAPRLQFAAVVGVLGKNASVDSFTVNKITVNELSTVATAFSLAQFINGADIAGASPGLENAGASFFTLVNPAEGIAGGVITDPNNGANNDSLAILNTLGNLVSVCGADSASAACDGFLKFAVSLDGSAPENTFSAVTNLVKNPTLALDGLYEIAHTANIYSPALDAAPQAWLIALLYTDTNLYASGRIVIDVKGNMWTNNNWQPGTQNPSNNINVLNTVGIPILNSPIYGGGLDGQGWGMAIAPDGTIWIGNYHGGTISKFSADGKPLSPDSGWDNGDLSFVQGMAFDQRGNLWIANNTGKDTPPGSGSIVVYPNGDPSQAKTITGGGIDHPFAVQIDDLGRAWVSNGGIGFEGQEVELADKFGGSITIINPDFTINPVSPITATNMRRPMGIALDSKGNAWVAVFDNDLVFQISPDGKIAGEYAFSGDFGPWGISVDGSDRVWVGGFHTKSLYLLCGVNTAACPPGSKTGDVLSPGEHGFTSQALQLPTSLQFDQAGNIWLSNNWSTAHPVTGGVGVVKLLGLATPVCAPLLGQPVNPSSVNSCPTLQATALPATGAEIFDVKNFSFWITIGVVLLSGGILLLLTSRARRPN